MGDPSARDATVRPLFEAQAASDAALVLGARAGQPGAQEALFKRYARVALGLAWRMMPEGDPEDLAQDALVHALTHLHQLQQPQAFAAWLKMIVVRLVSSRLSTRRLLQRLRLREPAEPDELEAVASRASSPEQQVELAQLYRRIGEFPTEERIALLLRRVEGLELSEVAELMKLSLATVKRRVAAAEARLNAMVHDE